MQAPADFIIPETPARAIKFLGDENLTAVLDFIAETVHEPITMEQDPLRPVVFCGSHEPGQTGGEKVLNVGEWLVRIDGEHFTACPKLAAKLTGA